MLSVNRLALAGSAAVLACLCILVPAARGEEHLWKTDFAAAKAQAKAEKKLLLVDFTGSDWCGWCIKLRKEAFDKEPFKSDAPKQFVLVELDFPHEKELPGKLQKQNEKLAKRYKVRGFPTVLVLDAEGELIAHTGYLPGGPEKYVKHLAELVDTYHDMERLRGQLAKAEGADRAKLLDLLVDGYLKLGNDSDELSAWSEEIVTLDGDNKAGLKTKHQARLWLAEVAQLNHGQKFDKVQAVVDKILALPGLNGEQKQDTYLAQCEGYFLQQDFSRAAAQLKKALKAAPESPQAARIKSLIANLQAQVDQEEAVVKLKAEAEKAEGLDRAKLLDRLVDAYGKFGNRLGGKDRSRDVEKWSQEIVVLDSENQAGLKQKYSCRALLMQSQKLLLAKKFAQAQTAADKALALPGLGDRDIQRASLLKSFCCNAQKDVQGALDCLKKAVKDAPQGIAQTPIPAIIRQYEKELKKKEKGEAPAKAAASSADEPKKAPKPKDEQAG